MKPSKEMSSWLIVLVVLATAFITSWAMLKYKPSHELNASYYYPPQQFAQHLSPGIATLQGGWQLAAGGNAIPAMRDGPPVIRAGAVAPHAESGVCTACHRVVGPRQKPIPPIQASSAMPHEYRGVCTNCHLLPNPSGINTNPYRMQAATPVVAMRPVVAPNTMTLQVRAPQTMTPRMTTPARAATEGEWLGMEVSPITPLTARQYGIAGGTQGLVVAEAEAQAAMAGFKAGDVIVSINGMPTPQMTAFFQATNNGTMTQGVVEFVRQGQRQVVNLAQTTNPALAGAPNTPTYVPPAGTTAAMPVVRGNFSMSPNTPMNFPAAGTRAAIPTPGGNFSRAPVNGSTWGTGQGIGGGRGMGIARGGSQGVGWRGQF